MTQLNYVKLLGTHQEYSYSSVLGIYFSLDGYNEDNVIYKWKDDPVKVEKKSMAQFDMKEVEPKSTTKRYISG